VQGPLRISRPAGWTDEAFAAGLASVQKALKAPIPRIARARARKGFNDLQKDFDGAVHAIYGAAEDRAKTFQAVTGAANKRLLTAYQSRQHNRDIQLLNRVFKVTYERAFEFGLRAGGRNIDEKPVSQREGEIIRRLRINENAYAGNFLTDIAHGEGTLNYKQRAQMYVKALEEVYWLGYVYSDLSRDRYIKWTLRSKGKSNWGGSDPCIDCAWLGGDFAALEQLGIDPDIAKMNGAGGRWGNGVYAVQELARMAVAPQSGKLTCTTHCHCQLKTVERPAGTPLHAKFLPWRSQLPKEFTGTEKRGKKTRVLRQHKQKRRKAYARRAQRTEHKHLRRR